MENERIYMVYQAITFTTDTPIPLWVIILILIGMPSSVLAMIFGGATYMTLSYKSRQHVGADASSLYYQRWLIVCQLLSIVNPLL